MTIRGVAALMLAMMVLSGCSRPAVITAADSEAVLVAAARAVRADGRRLAGYCVASVMRDGLQMAMAAADREGWMHLTADGAQYRVLPSPRLDRLPEAAIALFPRDLRQQGCRHTITFHQPKFVEIRKGGQTRRHALIDMGDYCTICGSGYVVELEQTRSGWVVQPPGIRLTWVS